RAEVTPPCSSQIGRTRGSSIASRYSRVSSVEPSSTTISSQSQKVCAMTDATALRKSGRRLYVDRTMETSGVPMAGTVPWRFAVAAGRRCRVRQRHARHEHDVHARYAANQPGEDSLALRGRDPVPAVKPQLRAHHV